MRQGFAYIASGRYDLAAASLKKGLTLDSQWPKSGFRLDGLYGANRLALGSHLDTLAAATLMDPGSADKLFLLGVFLHARGESDRAKKFLEGAAAIVGVDAPHIRPFFEAAPSAVEAVPPGKSIDRDL